MKNRMLLNNLKESGIKELKKDYIVIPASNGVGQTQVDRIESSKLKGLFDKFYISGFIGYQKPQKEFFDYIFNDLKEYKKEDFLMIGDSETSDIRGGINAGIDMRPVYVEDVWVDLNSTNDEFNTLFNLFLKIVYFAKF